MTQGIFIYGSRPPTKKYLKAQIEEVNTRLASGKINPATGELEVNVLVGADPYSVVIEATSVFGNEFDGSLAQAMDPKDPHYGPFTLVGPDPYNSRKWYATLEYKITDQDKPGRWILK